MKILNFILAVGLLFLKGVIISDFWNWFAAPLGVMEIGMFHAMGILFGVTILRYSYTPNDSDEKEKLKGLIHHLFTYLIGWGIGYLINLGL